MNYVKPVPKIKAHYAGSKQTPTRHTKTHSATSGTQDACTWCGRGRHDRQQCPARDAVCGLCQKKGNFRAVCRSAKQRANDVHQLEEVDLPYLGYVGAKASSDNDEHWTASVEVDGHSMSFKLDTGAAVSVVSDREPWLASADLQSSNKILRGPGASHIAVIGVMDATLTYNGKSFNELIYVIQNQEYSLLSRRACVGLEMIARVDNVEVADRASDLSCRTSVALQRDRQIENGASHHATSEFDSGLSVHGEENCASSVSTNQVGASVDGSSGDYLSSNCADAMVLRHGSSSEGKWVGSELCRPHATE